MTHYGEMLLLEDENEEVIVLRVLMFGDRDPKSRELGEVLAIQKGPW